MSFASSCGHPSSSTAAPHTPGLAEADRVLVTRLRQLAQSGDEMAQLVLKEEAKTPEELRHHWLFMRSKNGSSQRYQAVREELLVSHFGAKLDQTLEDLAAHKEWEKLARRTRLGKYKWTKESAMALLREKNTLWVHSLRESLFFWIGGPSRVPEHRKLQAAVAEAVANTFDEELITQYGSCVQGGLDLIFISHALEHQKYDLATNLLKRMDQRVNKGSPPHLDVDHAALRLGIIAQGPEKGPLFNWFFERTHDALPFRLPFEWAKPYYPALIIVWDRNDEMARADQYMCQVRHADHPMTDPKLFLDPHPDGHMYLYKGSEERQEKWQKPIRQVDIHWKGGQEESKEETKLIRIEQDSTVLVARTFVMHGPGLLNIREPSKLPHMETFRVGQRTRIVGRIARFCVLKRRLVRSKEDKIRMEEEY